MPAVYCKSPPGKSKKRKRERRGRRDRVGWKTELWEIAEGESASKDGGDTDGDVGKRLRGSGG